MKLYILTVMILLHFGQMGNAQNVGIGTANPLNKIHVAGDARIESLAGIDSRVVQTNTSGEVLEIPKGNTGEILTQTTTGPAWRPNTVNGGSGASSGTDTCCPRCGVMGNEPCPTMISALSSSTMTLGDCARYCAALTEGGFSDWRVPTAEEGIRLYHLTPVTTTTNFFWTLSTTGALGYSIIGTVDGRRFNNRADNNMSCHCVR